MICILVGKKGIAGGFDSSSADAELQLTLCCQAVHGGTSAPMVVQVHPDKRTWGCPGSPALSPHTGQADKQKKLTRACMRTGGLANHLALIALSHASLALADQAIPVGHAAIVLGQWLHLMARLALLQIKGSCMH